MTKYEKKQLIKAAKDLLYPPEVIRKLENTSSENECARITKTARQNSKY